MLDEEVDYPVNEDTDTLYYEEVKFRTGQRVYCEECDTTVRVTREGEQECGHDPENFLDADDGRPLDFNE